LYRIAVGGWLAKDRLIVSYVMKKRAAPGADPTIALPTPRYMPVKPPLEAKPEADCKRVLSVSRG
jgi:hypothetical protein